ncbi:extracellular solute-binding protein [Cochlodiniinecator piscidefendens]|uniref:extracellular solute-binding protein n=1 Tax=Cochlodiniinecator piscidefendens TaxID=2715756 RepID=UPI00140E2870|nr:extracellular solute-binding protein [Cochlodiniinecator piscidefendens]
MKSDFFRHFRRIGAVICIFASAGIAHAEAQHGIAMYGDPVLPPDFVSLPYANPDAPQGGQIIFGEGGGFDSLNPYILKGDAPWGIRVHVVESLMGRNWDEPFALYGLLAESIETGPSREWVEFTLREEAAFSDGSPVTVDDVIWSFETLGTEGHSRYRNSWGKVDQIEQVGERSLRITFNTPDLELALIMGLRPVLQRAQWEGMDFADSDGLDMFPIGTGPYVISDMDPGRQITFTRNPDYWGNDLPFNRGRHNLDEIRYDFFGDGDVAFEAFKAGETSSYREFNAAKWDNQYDFPAIQNGDIVQSLIPHQRPSGITGFVMNTRNPIFADWRVREALILAFNFEFINETLNGGTEPRITSYFSNSVLAMSHDAAQGGVLDLLEPFADDLLPGTIEGYSLPQSDGTTRNRRNIRAAIGLFEQAGWTVQNGIMADGNGTPFAFEILLQSGSGENQSIIDIYTSALGRLGITPTVSSVDSAQYRERANTYDFDMAYYRRGLSLSPGNEQRLYWGSEGITEPGTRNWMGMNSPAAEAMIDAMLNAESQVDFLDATRALDRILTAGRYVLPIWHNPVSRLAHARELHYPDVLPMYGDWSGFQPDVWWWEE